MLTIEQLVKVLSIEGVGRKSAKAISDSITFKMSSDEELADFILEISQSLPRLKKLDKSIILDGFAVGEKILLNSEKSGISLIAYTSENYPVLLAQSNDYPLVLSYMGNINAFSDQSIGIIGTREPSDYGYRVGIRFGEYFAQKGFTVVSGLALGCDTAGHLGCLKAGGKTIAVMAHGLQTIYPKENRYLAEKIIDQDGLIISEYFYGKGALANYFVERDRIQAGLSAAIIVIETGVKGGTMHTVKFCIENKRPVACFNHPIEYQNYDKVKGNRLLIKEGKGLPLSNSTEIDAFIEKLGYGQKVGEQTGGDSMIRNTDSKQVDLWE